jgi:predicted ATPase
MVNSLTSSNSSSNIRLDLSNLRVYGREKELEELNDVFERSKVQGQAVLLQAASGVGKTRLIEAFQQQLPANASVCIGHFQPSYTVPHNAIVDCFTELCDRLLDCSPEHVEQCESLEKVLDGDDKKVLINLVPRFQDLFKEVIVPNVDLDILHDWNFNRFQKVIVVVVKTIASNHHPLVMVFDDLQWADEASVRLLRDLAACDVQGFCFVGSYRINETSSEHPVSRYLESSVKMKCLTIGNLPVMACNQLIADTTQLRPALCQPLADIVHKKTSGNAFYIIQFLQLLQEQGSLHYSVKVFSWQWNLSRIEEETEVTDNVVENLLANKIKTMPNSTMHALMMAAAIGSPFGVELLASVCSAHDALEGSTMDPSSMVQVLALQKEELISSLTIAVDGQMITYRPSDQTYKFSHTRIQQASLKLSGLDFTC